MTIDDTRLKAGQDILALTDRFGFDALAAGWLHDRPTGKWRYFLVSQMLRSQGPRWIYDRLLKLFRQYDLPEGVSPLDIFVIDEATERAVFGAQMVAFQRVEDIGVGLTFSQEVKIDGFMITDGYVIFQRRLPFDVRRKHSDPAKRFDLTVRRLAA